MGLDHRCTSPQGWAPALLECWHSSQAALLCRCPHFLLQLLHSTLGHRGCFPLSLALPYLAALWPDRSGKEKTEGPNQAFMICNANLFLLWKTVQVCLKQPQTWATSTASLRRRQPSKHVRMLLRWNLLGKSSLCVFPVPTIKSKDFLL